MSEPPSSASSFCIKYRSHASKAKTEFDDIPCNEHGLSVIDIKQFLLNSNKFSKSSDFDFDLKEDVSNKSFDLDSMTVPPGTYVIFKRVVGNLMARLAAAAAAGDGDSNSNSNSNSSGSGCSVKNIATRLISISMLL